MRSINFRCRLLAVLFLLAGGFSSASAQPDLFGPAPVAFEDSSHLVSATMFHWYASTGGQLTGPWRPVEGRENWTGLPPWWKTQIQQIMAANIDMLYVHLIPQTEERRLTLFTAFSELRAEGYDVPKIAPFLDPLITWDGQPKVDVATQAGKDTVAAQYIRFYRQYFSTNTDPFAADYLAYIDNRPVLDTWHVFLNLDNVDSMKREDLSSRLGAEFGQIDNRFNQGIYMVTTALNVPIYSFSDERVIQFELNTYFHETTFNGIKSVQLKAGYWDQNVRNPGDFLPRDGGIHFADAWDQIDSTVDRIYIESWNEYDEGTGIYAGDVGLPYLHPGSGNTSTDTWSSTNDPYEYIHTTALGAAKFNDYPALNSRLLRQDVQVNMRPNESSNATFRIRNEGNETWSNARGVSFQQLATDPVQFANASGTLDDSQNDIPIFGGIFKGRPVDFAMNLTAPLATGIYDTHWQMMKNDTAFGPEITISIEVSGFPVSVTDPAFLQQAVTLESAPNPATDFTQFTFELPIRAEDLSLKVYDMMGREIAVLTEGTFPAGTHAIDWRISNVTPGMYLCELTIGDQIIRRNRLVIQ